MKRRTSKVKRETTKLWLLHGVRAKVKQVKMSKKKGEIVALWPKEGPRSKKMKNFKEITLEHLLTFIKENLAQGLLNCVRYEQEYL